MWIDDPAELEIGDVVQFASDETRSYVIIDRNLSLVFRDGEAGAVPTFNVMSVYDDEDDSNVYTFCFEPEQPGYVGAVRRVATSTLDSI